MISRATQLLVFLLLPVAISASAETVGTFTLDGLSFISFGDREHLQLPAGSTLEFRFGAPRPDGTIPFSIDPSGVDIQDVALPGGGVLRYALAETAVGSMHAGSDGRRLSFGAVVRATLETGGGNDGSYDYAVPFTTETTAASNVSGTRTLSVSGMRLVEGVWYGQIVGSTTNKENAFPEPGAAVYTVLSGSFDHVP
jgi:hypothetical protein